MTTKKWLQFVEEVKRQWSLADRDLAAHRNVSELAEHLRDVTALPLHRIQREIQQMMYEFEGKVRCATDTQKSAAA